MKDVSAQQALEVLADVADLSDLTLDTGFGTLKLDSLMLVEWISVLEEKLDAELDIRDLSMQDLESMSIGDAIESVRKRVVSAKR